MKEIEIPRRIYKLPKAEIERLYMDVSRGLEGDGKGTFTAFFPVNERLWVNEERLVTQLKFYITYCRKEIYFYERIRLKATNKASHVNCEGHIERIEWVPEGLLLVPHGSPYHENPDLLIAPEDERMTDYMPYEQCNRCKLDHCCWSNGSFIWEDGNTPNNCKEFIPEDERMSCKECCQDCYAYDFENGWCMLWSEFRPPGDVCMGFDYPKPEDP